MTIRKNTSAKKTSAKKTSPKKGLLSESQRRQFMKLAMIKPIHENWGLTEEEQEDDMEADLGADEADMDAEGSDMDVDMDMGADMEGDVDSSSVAGEIEITTDQLKQFADLTDAAGELVKQLKGAMGPEESDDGDDVDADADMDAEGSDMGADMDEKSMMEALRGISYVPSRKEVVNEVAKRVAKRLAEAQKAEKRMNEALGRSTKRK